MTLYPEQKGHSMANKNQTGSMLTVREVSQLLHVHSNTVRRWTDKGMIRAYRIGPRGDRKVDNAYVSVIIEYRNRVGGDPLSVIDARPRQRLGAKYPVRSGVGVKQKGGRKRAGAC